MRREGWDGVLRKMEKMQVTGNRLPGRSKGTWEQLVLKERTEGGADNESKKLEKVVQRSTNIRERKGLQAKMMIMKRL